MAKARHGKALKIAAVAKAAVYRLQIPPFVPPPVRRAAEVAVHAVAAAGAVAPAFADGIGDAAKKLSEEPYPFMKEMIGNSYTYLTQPGKGSAGERAKAVDKEIVMGASLDSDLLKQGVEHITRLSVLRPRPTL